MFFDIRKGYSDSLAGPVDLWQLPQHLSCQHISETKGISAVPKIQWGHFGVCIVIFAQSIELSNTEVILLTDPSCCALVRNVSRASETGFLLYETKVTHSKSGGGASH